MRDLETRQNFKKSSNSLSQVVEYDATLGKDLSLPAVFQQAGPWISLTENIVQSAQTELDKGNAKSVGEDLYLCSKVCKERSELLETVFNYVANAEAAARRKKYAEVLALDKERAVELLLGGIVKAIVDTIKSGSLVASDTQKADLEDALKKLSAMAANTPEGGGGFNFYGVGDMITNLGSGKINVGKDHATLYVGDNVNVGVESSKK